MEETLASAEAAQIPQQRGASLLETAARYAEERHWEVVPGAWLETTDGVPHCSCGDPACAAPGAHPAREDWAAQATGSVSTVRRMWQARPAASILLPTGRAFDALDVPETAGFLALARMERMELALGPVTLAPDRRMRFFVLPGAAAKLADLVRGVGWSPSSLDLTALGEGGYVAAPPTRYGTRGAVLWARRPTPANRWLPDAEELVPSLAYACGRDR
ncbi:bifunctional DNA primase/polymerase [Streptomyces tagetis]|uniref:Bifunctional DNA primase/polymerase n=1 Tax=Streptomyces tagetis TaxID=2820809 RepID=A0A941B2N5_9ACTN|nr:bifunctional DNA primase/polymerase [Streptomyces sp. RG38]MBQ0829346.1 bifunctional DNA primase/polymerase [Streptomyces sp. RG38]